MALKRPGDALKAKQRKQKIFIAIGAAALLGVGVFEYPMVMKLMGGGGGAPPPPPAQTAAAPTGASGTPTSFAPPTPGAAGAAPVAAVGELVESDVPPAATQTRLVGFNLFPSKDPFVQQVSPVTQTAETGPGSTSHAAAHSAGGAPSTADKPSADVPSADSVGASGKSVVPASPSDGSSSAAPTSAGDAPVETVTISVNGREEPVGKGGTFPHSAPTFRLVSFGKGTAEIGIVGGSYATGGETVTLKRGEPLTLVNTTDDTRYRIVLVRTP